MGKNFLFPLFILLAFLQAQQEFGKITLPLGRVEVSSSGSDEWNKAKVKQKVYSGDLIRVFHLVSSHLVIAFHSNSVTFSYDNVEISLSKTIMRG